MSKVGQSTISGALGLLGGALLAVLSLGGCANGGAQQTGPVDWPTVDATSSQPPEDLEIDAPTPLLRGGNDGHLYVVGLADKVRSGQPFVARYSGEWPLGDLPRPPRATGRVVEYYKKQAVARVHITYKHPRAELEGLEVTWSDSPPVDDVAKGVVGIVSIAEGTPWSLTLNKGGQKSVVAGDAYAILSNPEPGAPARALQLTRRLVGVCVVQDSDDKSATCDGLQLGADNQFAPRAPRTSDVAVFLEHRVSQPPREALIQVARVAGDSSKAGALRERLLEAMKAYVEGQDKAKAAVAPLDLAVKAGREDFHRVQERIDYQGRPQMALAAEIIEREDGPHLIVNYTGIGPAAGPGMVAAPPHGGVDLGHVGRITDDQLEALAGTVWSGLLVYRGQTHRALAQLFGLLRSPKLQGPLRWHARDQYAMRWGAYGHYREALWLVLEDETLADNDNDERARLNALGTRVRLYDFLGLPEQAVDTAQEFLEAFDRESETSSWVGAMGMYAEMLMASEQYKNVRKQLDRLKEACPEGCRGDLFSYLAGIWWAAPENAPDSLRGRLLKDMVALGQGSDPSTMAAARLYQGVEMLGERKLDQALIAFLESDRLYEKAKMLEGQARAKYFLTMTHSAQNAYQKAFEAGRAALKMRRELRDFQGIARTYMQLANMYANLELEKPPGRFLGYAKAILTGAVESQRARGDVDKTAEGLFTFGSFLFRIGSEGAERKLKAAIGYAIQSSSFDIAALSHLYLAMIARRNQDRREFQQQIQRAQTMGELADDPRIKKAIDRALNPPQNRDKEVPSELL